MGMMDYHIRRLQRMRPEQLLKRLETKDFAFLLGNGVNRYIMGNDVDCSWKGLLKQVASYFDVIHNMPSLDVTNNISYPEYYSMLLLKAKDRADEKSIQEYIKSLIHSWPNKAEYGFIKKALFDKYDCPVLTTNVDTMLDGIEYSENEDSYVFPATLHYSKEGKENHLDGCSIWHINGTINHIESVRFGSIDYSKQIHRVYAELDKNKSKGKDGWRNTWVRIITDKPLCIVGLGLELDEFFLRSLLLRKVRYSNGLSEYGWYCYTASDVLPDDKRDFLLCMGIEPVMFDSYDDMYGKLFGVTNNHFEND